MNNQVSDLDKFIEGVNAGVDYCHESSYNAGWWSDENGTHLLATPYSKYVIATKLMLCVSEIAEAMEGERKGLMDDKLPHRKMGEVELADLVIRAFDLAGALGYDLGGAIKEKMGFNQVRPDHKVENRAKDGGKKF